MVTMQLHEQLGKYLNDLLKGVNYSVTPKAPKGKPARNNKSTREYRLQLINKQQDTSVKAIQKLKTELKKNKDIKGLKFNTISPNSSKFPSFSFSLYNNDYDVIIARGANRGENFETQTVKNLDRYLRTRNDIEMRKVMEMMGESYQPFAGVEIVKAKQRTGSTKKEGKPIEKLGSIIGDIVLTDSSGNEWFVSLKDINGYTFSSYSGAASLFDREGTLQPNSEGAVFLQTFGVDLNQVQAGFDERAGKNTPRPTLPVNRANSAKIEKIFNRAWGMNYFYMKKESSGWKIFWLGKQKLDKLCQSISIDEIRYPSKKSKQITILCSNSNEKYLIEMRNSKGAEYPNDIKFKVRK